MYLFFSQSNLERDFNKWLAAVTPNYPCRTSSCPFRHMAN